MGKCVEHGLTVFIKRFQKKGTPCCPEIQTIQSFGIPVMGLDILCDPFYCFMDRILCSSQMEGISKSHSL